MKDSFVKLIPTEILEKLYDDTMSKPAKEVGKLLAEIIKGLSLFTAPFLAMSTCKNRIERYLSEIESRVPKEKQIQADAFYSGPIIERLKYIEDTHYLKDYYLNLLENAINKDYVSNAHPAFPIILNQLSPDEIMLLEAIQNDPIITTYEYKRDHERKIIEEKVTDTNYDFNCLNFKEHRKMYIEHLQELNLIRISSKIPETFNLNSYLTRTMQFELDEFGVLFMKACKR